jgi:hypothetical protein
VRDVGDQGAQGHDHLDPESLGGLGDALREGAPAEIRLRPREEDEVALRPRRGSGEQDVARPFDLPGLALVEADRRPIRLKVEELLGVDLGDDLGLERVCCGGERGCRRAGGVVPAGERTNEDR